MPLAALAPVQCDTTAIKRALVALLLQEKVDCHSTLIVY
jgi:hypothetical protein